MMNRLKTTLLLAFLSAIIIGIGYLLGGFSGITIGLIIAIVMNFSTYWFSDKLVLAMYRARKLDKKEYPWLYEIVKDVSKKAGVPMPKIYLVPSNIANAFATGRNPKHASIALTQGILRILSREELKGVIAHEISHIKNRDILIQTIASTLAAVISYVAFILRWSFFFGGIDNRREGNVLQLIALIAIAILAPFAALLIQLAISRTREFLADETGAKIIKNSKALANALLKLEQAARLMPLRQGNPSTASLFIVNPFRKDFLTGLFSTHPPIKKRIERLEKLKF